MNCRFPSTRRPASLKVRMILSRLPKAEGIYQLYVVTPLFNLIPASGGPYSLTASSNVYLPTFCFHGLLTHPPGWKTNKSKIIRVHNRDWLKKSGIIIALRFNLPTRTGIAILFMWIERTVYQEKQFPCCPSFEATVPKQVFGNPYFPPLRRWEAYELVWYFFLNWDGVIPTVRRNIRVKADWSEYPQRELTLARDFSVVDKSRVASCNRVF